MNFGFLRILRTLRPPMRRNGQGDAEGSAEGKSLVTSMSMFLFWKVGKEVLGRCGRYMFVWVQGES